MHVIENRGLAKKSRALSEARGAAVYSSSVMNWTSIVDMLI